MDVSTKAATAIGLGVFLGFASLGYALNQTAIAFKSFERVVTVKGLSEREYSADKVIWPIQFTLAGNELPSLINALNQQAELIKTFLHERELDQDLQVLAPAIIDKQAQQYGSEPPGAFRYIATQTLTLTSDKISQVQTALGSIGELAKQGIVFSQNSYQNQVSYGFSKLNDVKPAMIEEATKNAREVAKKFAADSQSRLGKIRTASQGQFSIQNRDSNTPQIKKVRVVSTVQYYLSD